MFRGLAVMDLSQSPSSIPLLLLFSGLTTLPRGAQPPGLPGAEGTTSHNLTRIRSNGHSQPKSTYSRPLQADPRDASNDSRLYEDPLCARHCPKCSGTWPGLSLTTTRKDTEMLSHSPRTRSE